jgi:hypothetical protein
MPPLDRVLHLRVRISDNNAHHDVEPEGTSELRYMTPLEIRPRGTVIQYYVCLKAPCKTLAPWP